MICRVQWFLHDNGRNLKCVKYSTKNAKALYSEIIRCGSNFMYWSITTRLGEKCLNTEYFLVRIFLYLDWIKKFTLKNMDQKKLSVCIIFTQCLRMIMINQFIIIITTLIMITIWKGNNSLGIVLLIFTWLTNENSVLNSFQTGTNASRLGIIPASNTILVTTVFQKWFVALMWNYQTCN